MCEQRLKRFLFAVRHGRVEYCRVCLKARLVVHDGCGGVDGVRPPWISREVRRPTLATKHERY